MAEIKKKQLHSYLSDDLIIEEILSRLPIKSIFRFKSVSKQWYSTLSSSNFANAHLIKYPFFHPTAPVNTLFIIDHYNCCYLFSYDDDNNDDQVSGNFEDNLVKLDVDFGLEDDNLRLTGCCNGLVCLTPDSKKYFIVWNPATRKIYKYESVGLHGYVKSTKIICGFGYSSSVDDYKYVRIMKLGGGNNCVHIFSLRENMWRKIDFHHDVVSIRFSRPVVINEKLYWCASCSQAGNVILSFDLGVERFDLVKGSYFYLGVMGGCLSKCNLDRAKSTNSNDTLMHIIESPSIVKSIYLPKGLPLGVGTQMIGFTSTGKFFLSGPLKDEDGVWYGSLGIVDTSTKPVQYARLLRFDDMITIAKYVPSLISPFPFEDVSRA